MTRLLKNISAIVAVAIIISVIAVPAFAIVNALDYSCYAEYKDTRSLHVVRMKFSYWGGDGRDVYYWCNIETNLGYRATYSDVTNATSLSITSPWLEYDGANPPFIEYCGATVYYD